MRWHLARNYGVYAELFKRQNKSRTSESMAKVIEIFKECSADGSVKKAEEERLHFHDWMSIYCVSQISPETIT